MDVTVLDAGARGRVFATATLGLFVSGRKWAMRVSAGAEFVGSDATMRGARVGANEDALTTMHHRGASKEKSRVILVTLLAQKTQKG